MVVDPPDGRVPLKPEAIEQRDAALALDADSLERYGPWERCITRGVPGSMWPGAYNNGHQIVQTPGYVVLHSEMIHEARVIPLDGRPHLGAGRQVVGRRFARPLGRRHAGDQHHQLQRERLDRDQCGGGTAERHCAQPGRARGRAPHPRRRKHDSVRSHHRRSEACTPALDRGVSVEQGRAVSDLRIRVSRRQLTRWRTCCAWVRCRRSHNRPRPREAEE